jgi:hypothetical protein
MKFPLFLILVLLPSLLCGESENHYQSIFAKAVSGEMEVIMGDKTRCDVVTDTHAIEVEFARKWTEGLGQSLWYSFQTNKRAGIVLIIEDMKDERFLTKLRSLIVHRQIKDVKIWTIDGAGEITEQ